MQDRGYSMKDLTKELLLHYKIVKDTDLAWGSFAHCPNVTSC